MTAEAGPGLLRRAGGAVRTASGTLAGEVPDLRMTRRTWRRIILGLAVLVTFLGAALMVAAWRNDNAIESHMQSASAEVLSSGRVQSSVSFITPDGVTRSPPDGVLYPTGLAEGRFIEVEYDARDPETVRVAGRGAGLTVVPVLSVVAGTWAVAGVLLVLLRDGGVRPGRVASRS